MKGRIKEVTLTELDIIKATDFNICPHCDFRLVYSNDNSKYCEKCGMKIVINKDKGSGIFNNITLKKHKRKF